ncbi:MAG: DUF445 family protein [Kyrpidia sp.]|nr:DUF445 family protein [Kyrpidia sp.]
MHLIQVLLSVITGAFIGLATNGLAIAMLFRPWHTWRIGRWRVPLTPGLIPRRREEIAQRLGEIVQEYLLPAEGMRRAIGDADIGGALDKARDHLIAWVEKEGIHRAAGRIVDWTQGERSQTSETMSFEPLLGVLRDLGLGTARRAADSEAGSAWIRTLTEKSLEFAVSATQDLRVRRGLGELVQRWLLHQGWLGRLAGALGAEDRVAEEFLRALREWLAAPGTHEAVVTWVRRELLPGLLEVLEREPRDGPAIRVWVDAAKEQWADHAWLEDELGKVWQWVKDLVGQWEPRLRPRVLKQLETALPRVWRQIPVANIVEEQVNRFPLPEFERLVVDVARRELAMITWMGAVLGGIVGFGQALLATLV